MLLSTIGAASFKDVDFLLENSSKSEKWLARNLKRTVHSISSKLYVLQNPPAKKLAEIPLVEKTARVTVEKAEEKQKPKYEWKTGKIDIQVVPETLAKLREEEAYKKGHEVALSNLANEIIELEKKPERVRRVRILFGFLLDIQW